MPQPLGTMEVEFFGEVSSLLNDLTNSLGASIVLRHSAHALSSSSVIPQLPRPLTTAGFPLSRRRRPPVSEGGGSVGGGSKRPRPDRSAASAVDCPVCLESVGTAPLADVAFPCGHRLHRVCTHGLLTLPVLGSDSMMRCPLCRYALDRYDLRGMGFDVHPSHLRVIGRRCAAVRALGSGGGMTGAFRPDYARVAALVGAAAGTRSSDGFVYNTAVLALERAVYHRRGIVRGIADQLRAGGVAGAETAEFVACSVACHVQVLMETAHAADEDYLE